LSFTASYAATPTLLPSLKWKLLRKPFPYQRMIRAFSPTAYKLDLPDQLDAVGLSPVTIRCHFPQAAARATKSIHPS